MWFKFLLHATLEFAGGESARKFANFIVHTLSINVVYSLVDRLVELVKTLEGSGVWMEVPLLGLIHAAHLGKFTILFFLCIGVNGVLDFFYFVPASL